MSLEYKPPEKSLKGRYPFRIGTTSFIYPDLYSENVRILGPYIDEVELLFFESQHPDSLPDEYEINRLADLKEEHGLTFNVHLPTDVSIAAGNPTERKKAVTAHAEVIRLTSVLEPVSYTLHIPYAENPGGPVVWQAYGLKGLGMLLETGIDPELISIETLEYDPELLRPFLERHPLSLCMDIGHLLVHGYDPNLLYQEYRDRIRMIHLHGYVGESDHLALDVLKDETVAGLVQMLSTYTESLSLEIFSYNDLVASMRAFEAWFPDAD